MYKYAYLYILGSFNHTIKKSIVSWICFNSSLSGGKIKTTTTPINVDITVLNKILAN